MRKPNEKDFYALFEETQYLKDIDYIGLYHNTDFDLFDDEDALSECIMEDYIHNEEIIYYGAAMEFLSKEDPSLMESLSIAHESGLTINNLNSEVLATILYQHLLTNELHDIDFSTIINDTEED